MSILRDIQKLSEIVAELSKYPLGKKPNLLTVKGKQDFVTNMDLEMEALIRTRLEIDFPGIDILGEESVVGDESISNESFLIDPLDGTGNWIAGIPFAAVSVALIKNGETILSAVADIAHQKVYAAGLHTGSYLDGVKLTQVENPSDLMCLSTGMLERILEKPQKLKQLREIGKVRNLGAQALQLCLVADGTLAFSLSIEAKLWDDCAGRLIVTEAGGNYKNFINDKDKKIASHNQRSLAAHSSVFAEVSDVVEPLMYM